jgi:hypothetical protein
MKPLKTVEQCQKAIAQAVARAYDVRMSPVEISKEHAGRDPRSFIKETAGRPHRDLGVAQVAALAVSRAEKMNGDAALASTIADLMDGGVILDRQAASPRDLEALMAQHRAQRAKKNPLPSDLRAKAREKAPLVIRRSSGTEIKKRSAESLIVRVAIGCRVLYRRLDDGSEHDVVIGTPLRGVDTDATTRVLPAGSPLAQALFGATKGTIVPVTLGTRSVELEVLEVRGSS